MLLQIPSCGISGSVFSVSKPASVMVMINNLSLNGDIRQHPYMTCPLVLLILFDLRYQQFWDNTIQDHTAYIYTCQDKLDWGSLNPFLHYKTKFPFLHFPKISSFILPFYPCYFTTHLTRLIRTISTFNLPITAVTANPCFRIFIMKPLPTATLIPASKALFRGLSIHLPLKTIRTSPKIHFSFTS